MDVGVTDVQRVIVKPTDVLTMFGWHLESLIRCGWNVSVIRSMLRIMPGELNIEKKSTKDEGKIGEAK